MAKRLLKPTGTLKKWVKDKAIVKGEVTLASGAKSDYYFDCRRLSLWSPGLKLLAQTFFEGVFPLAPTAIGGPATAAIPLVAATILEFDSRDMDMDGFFVRSEKKDHGLQNVIEGKQLTPVDRVILLEDVVTSGGSLVKAAEAVRATGASVTAVFCILDRLKGAKDLDWGAPFEALFTIRDFGYEP